MSAQSAHLPNPAYAVLWLETLVDAGDDEMGIGMVGWIGVMVGLPVAVMGCTPTTLTTIENALNCTSAIYYSPSRSCLVTWMYGSVSIRY